jgi:hypothetical protein
VLARAMILDLTEAERASYVGRDRPARRYCRFSGLEGALRQKLSQVCDVTGGLSAVSRRLCASGYLSHSLSVQLWVGQKRNPTLGAPLSEPSTIFSGKMGSPISRMLSPQMIVIRFSLVNVFK